MSEKLEVTGLTKAMLSDAINQNTFWKDNLAPLPKSKAIWLVSNPRIKDDDYCGVLGFEDDKMIAFIYMIPDQLNVKSDNYNENKVYWMILWWVNSKYKDTVFGTYLYNEAVNYAGKQVLIKSYAEHVNAFYEKQPFKVIASRLRYTIFFSLETSILIGRFKFLKPFKFFLNNINALTKSIVRAINTFKNKSRTNTLTYDYITRLDDEIWEFIEPLCEKDLIYKTKEYVNWQIDNNQYLQTPVSKHPYKSIQAGISNNIHIHNLKIIKDDKIIGFLSYIVNYNEFNVKYFLTKEERYYDICVDALMENFIKQKTTFIFTDDTKLSNNITKRYTSIFTHKTNKKALAHNEMKSDISNLNLLNRDGHFY